MNTQPLLSCHLTYGFETLDAISAADLLELILNIPLSKNDSDDFDSKLYEYHAPSAEVGELESVLLFDNRITETNCKESLFPECWFVAHIVWRTTNLLEPGRLDAAIKVCGDVRIKLIRYQISGDLFEDGVNRLLNREFHSGEKELQWDSHFNKFESEAENESCNEEFRL